MQGACRDYVGVTVLSYLIEGAKTQIMEKGFADHAHEPYQAKHPCQNDTYMTQLHFFKIGDGIYFMLENCDSRRTNISKRCMASCQSSWDLVSKSLER